MDKEVKQELTEQRNRIREFQSEVSYVRAMLEETQNSLKLLQVTVMELQK